MQAAETVFHLGGAGCDLLHPGRRRMIAFTVERGCTECDHAGYLLWTVNTQQIGQRTAKGGPGDKYALAKLRQPVEGFGGGLVANLPTDHAVCKTLRLCVASQDRREGLVPVAQQVLTEDRTTSSGAAGTRPNQNT